MKTNYCTYVIIALIICGGFGLLGGCGGGGDSVRGSTTVTSFVSARVTDANGDPVSGASASLNSGEKIFTTDSDGRFSVPMSNIGSGGVSLYFAVSRGGYFTLFHTATVMPENLVDGVADVELTLRRMPDSSDQATRGTLVRADGSTEQAVPVSVSDPGTGLSYTKTTITITGDDRAVTFSTPPDGSAPAAVSFTIGDPDGAGDNAAAVLGGAGDVSCSIFYGDPEDTGDLEFFPGDFTTESDTGSGAGTGALISAGFAMIDVSLDSSEVAGFQSGTSARVTMRVPGGVSNPETGYLVAEGDSIPIFVFDETTGEWVVDTNTDGSVKRSTVMRDSDGLYVEFEITHLSWYNLDWKSDICPNRSPRIRFIDQDGNPVTGVRVSAEISGWSDCPHFITDDNVGFFNAPADVDWVVNISKNNYVSGPVTIHACADSVSGESDFTVTLAEREIACSTDNDCDDDDALTYDRCRNPGTYSSYCENSACNIPCSSNADCDDGNENTLDFCYGGGTCSASCSHCYSICSSDSDCDDGDTETVDSCVNSSTCDAYCVHNSCTPACNADTDCNDYDAMTVDTCTGPGTCDAACSNTPCSASCSTNADCDDQLRTTIDTCANSGTCDAYCINTSCAVICTTDSGCEDDNPLTEDSCFAPGTCDAACRHIACTPACSADSDCDDSDPLTIDSCTNSGTCDAVCSNTPCAIRCSSDTDCNDGDDLTTDICNDPGTCDAACSNTSCIRCSSDTDCDDGGDLTIDACNDPGTCDASCSYTGWYGLGGSVIADGVSNGLYNACMPAIALDANDNPMVSWLGMGTNNDGYLKRWTGTSWEPMGETSLIVNSVGFDAPHAMISNLMGNPIIVWCLKSGVSEALSVIEWDGTGWTQLGELAEFADGITYYSLSMAADANGLPVVAWVTKNYSGEHVFIKRWDGSSWNEIGTGSATGTGISINSRSIDTLAIATGENDSIFVSWIQKSENNEKRLVAREWNGSEWGDISTFSALNLDAVDPEYMSVVPDGRGGQIIVFQDEYAYISYACLWDGSTWSDISETAFTCSATNIFPDITSSPDGTPVLAFLGSETADPYHGGIHDIYFKTWDGSSWIDLGPGRIDENIFVNFFLSNLKIKAGAAGKYYVTWTDDSTAIALYIYLKVLEP